jgi:hypothetical protein
MLITPKAALLATPAGGIRKGSCQDDNFKAGADQAADKLRASILISTAL